MDKDAHGKLLTCLKEQLEVVEKLTALGKGLVSAFGNNDIAEINKAVSGYEYWVLRLGNLGKRFIDLKKVIEKDKDNNTSQYKDEIDKTLDSLQRALRELGDINFESSVLARQGHEFYSTLLKAIGTDQSGPLLNKKV